MENLDLVSLFLVQVQINIQGLEQSSLMSQIKFVGLLSPFLHVVVNFFHFLLSSEYYSTRKPALNCSDI